MQLSEILEALEPYFDLIQLAIFVIISIVIFSILLQIIKRHLIKKVKGKKQVSNVIVFLDLLKFIFAIFLIISVVIAYHGNLGELGFIAGLLTVAVGWALQKPIAGVVAWLIIITRRPFSIGDRVILLNTKGDISNITLTHIYLDEVGGTIDGEEQSGRTVMIPTSIIFDQQIINYTEKDEYILDEVTTAITYESNLEKAEKLIKKAVNKIMKPYWENFPQKIIQEPHIRLRFRESGIDVTARYYSLATQRNKISTDITREIFKNIKQTKDVEIAYPHAEVLLHRKK